MCATCVQVSTEIWESVESPEVVVTGSCEPRPCYMGAGDLTQVKSSSVLNHSAPSPAPARIIKDGTRFLHFFFYFWEQGLYLQKG